LLGRDCLLRLLVLSGGLVLCGGVVLGGGVAVPCGALEAGQI